MTKRNCLFSKNLIRTN